MPLSISRFRERNNIFLWTDIIDIEVLFRDKFSAPTESSHTTYERIHFAEYIRSYARILHFVMDFQIRDGVAIHGDIRGVHRKHSSKMRTNPFRCLFHELCLGTTFSEGLTKLKSRFHSEINLRRPQKALIRHTNESIPLSTSQVMRAFVTSFCNGHSDSRWSCDSWRYPWRTPKAFKRNEIESISLLNSRIMSRNVIS